MALSEADLVERYFAPLAGPRGLGLSDDAALFRPPQGYDLVITTDMIADGVHFLDDPPEAVAAKALGVNMSDLAAKGAEPVGYSLGLGIGDGWTVGWVSEFAEALAKEQERYGIKLFGGDTIRVMGGTVVSVTAYGKLPSGEMVTRSGAAPDDIVVVSGTIGDAALGLLLRQGREIASPEAEGFLLRRLVYPEPRLALAPLLRRFASSAMDVSDGLVGDITKLCAASAVSAEIWVGHVPFSDAARSTIAGDSELLETALTGGEDFEILATVPEAEWDELYTSASAAGVKLTAIGRTVASGETPIFVDNNGREVRFTRSSYDHLAGLP